MIHALHSLRASAILSIALALFLAAAADSAMAGQPRAPQSPIPGRLQKVREGDWVLVMTGEGLIKETATAIHETEADPENDIEYYYMIDYQLEKFDASTGKPLDKPMTVARALEHEQEDHAEIVKNMAGKADRKKTKIDGKTVNVVTVRSKDENGFIMEEWFTDELGIDGRVAIVVSGEDIEPYTALQVVAFGNAKTPLAINKYLQKK